MINKIEEINTEKVDKNWPSSNFELDCPTVLLVESRRTNFTDSVLLRKDLNVVLLRFASEPITEAYKTRTKNIPTFVLNSNTPLTNEAKRYHEWTNTIGITPKYFCNPNEARQTEAQRFAQLVNLPSLTEEQVSWVRNKMAMKDRYQEIGIPHALYRPVFSKKDIADFAGEYEWPVILKPIDSDSCISTYRIDNEASLYTIPELNPLQHWMVEQFIRGREYQLCALVVKGKVLDAYISMNPQPILNVLEGAMNANITLARTEKQPLDGKALAQRLADGLRIQHGYLHGEFFITESGDFYMSEIAARPSGCEVCINHGLAYGFDFLRDIMDSYLDREPTLKYTLNRSVGDLLLPIRRGRVLSVSSNAAMLALPGVISSHITVGVGDIVNPPRASHASSGYVHVEGSSAAEVEQRMQYILDNYVIEIERIDNYE